MPPPWGSAYTHVQEIVDGAVASLKSYSSYVMDKQRYELVNCIHDCLLLLLMEKLWQIEGCGQ